jgi:hypothetical protein
VPSRESNPATSLSKCTDVCSTSSSVAASSIRSWLQVDDTLPTGSASSWLTAPRIFPAESASAPAISPMAVRL